MAITTPLRRRMATATAAQASEVLRDKSSCQIRLRTFGLFGDSLFGKVDSAQRENHFQRRVREQVVCDQPVSVYAVSDGKHLIVTVRKITPATH